MREPRVLLAAAAVVIGLAVLTFAVVTGRPGEPSAIGSRTPRPSPEATSTDQHSAPPTEGPTRSAGPSTTPRATPTPMPSGPAMLSWRSADGPGGLAVAWLGDRWLVGGSAGTRAATWTSADGLSWQAGVPMDPAGSIDLEHSSRSWITDVIAHRGRLLAVGWNGIGSGDGGRAVSWSSARGRRWTFLDPAGTAFGARYHFPIRLTHAPSGDLVLLSGTGLGRGNTTFVSRDGRTWQERPVSAWKEASLSDIAASDELMLAVGIQYGPGSVRRPLVFASDDATTWLAAAIPPHAGGLSAVAHDPVRNRFLVVGSDERGHPTVWLSPDARSWARTRLADAQGRVQRIAANGSGLIAAVGSTGEGDDSRPVVWASHDGVTWSINPLDATGFTAVGVGPTVIAVSGFPEPGRIWVGTPR